MAGAPASAGDLSPIFLVAAPNSRLGVHRCAIGVTAAGPTVFRPTCDSESPRRCESNALQLRHNRLRERRAMRVLIFKRRCGAGGVQSWLWNLTRQLRAMGVTCDLWFFEEGTRAGDFKALDGVRWGQPCELIRSLRRREYDGVHVANNEPFRDLLECVRPIPKIVASAHGELGDAWRYPACFAYT